MPPLWYLSHQIGAGYVFAADAKLHCCVPGRGPAPGAARRRAARHAHDLVLAPAARAGTIERARPRGDALPDRGCGRRRSGRGRVDGADDAKPTRSAPVPVAQPLDRAVDGTADDGRAVYPREADAAAAVHLRAGRWLGLISCCYAHRVCATVLA